MDPELKSREVSIAFHVKDIWESILQILGLKVDNAKPCLCVLASCSAWTFYLLL